MGQKNKRVDVYIDKSTTFAQPILNHIRELIHETCPDVEETIKWGFPHFEYHGVLCSMASFKQHCAFGFWKATLMADPYKVLSKVGETAMGHFGQLKELSDLPSDKILRQYIKEAMKLNEKGIKTPVRTKSGEKKELMVPDYFRNALSKNKKALKTFYGFSTTNKREYVEWVTEAKSDDTRDKRLATALEWMAEGKIRHWKYVR